MKRLIFIALFLCGVIVSKGQCDCEIIDQGNGLIYFKCIEFVEATNEVSQIKIGLLSTGVDRFLYMYAYFEKEVQVINSMLTLLLENEQFVTCILVKREIRDIEGIKTSYGLFSTSDQDLSTLGKFRIQSVTFHLADGTIGTYEVTKDLKKIDRQITCLKNHNQALQSAKAYRTKANEAIQNKDYENALIYITHSIILDSTYVESYVIQGLCLSLSKRYQQAYNVLSEAIALYPDYSNLYDHRAGVLQDLEQYASAQEDYNNAIRLAESPRQKAQYLNSRALLKNHNGDLNGGYEDLLKALESDSNYVAALNSMGTTCSQLGKPDEAMNYLRKAVLIDSMNYTLYINIGFIYQEKGENKTAVEFFNKAIILNPESPLCFSNRSLSNFRLGETDQALVDINKSIEIWNNNPYAYWVRALIYLEQEQNEMACSDLKTAISYGYTKYYGDEVEMLKSKHCKN